MKNILLPLAIVALVSACATNQKIQPVKPHTHTHHDHDHHDHGWDYAHPEKWGDQEVNRLCKTGVGQSPINIHQVTKPAPNSKGQFNLKSNYHTTDFEVVNNGHTIVFNAKSDNNTLSINGVNYKLLQFHYHVPSEHTVMNAFYPLEIHFVHQNASGNLAVVGVLVDKGAHNADFNKILTNLPTTAATKGMLKNFNIETLMPKNSATYAYDGSLTTPPCSEQVQWLLKANPISASTAQLNTLSKLYNGNNRPVQPQNNRTVYVIE
ncbi:carbonic anhydrase family protein [Moraxella sp. Tifton1]|uniref:carbonic anhydrase n=1 Tax=Moraxella oculi TaxID=2940516 RepID=UPI002012F0C9|nr:carbonic anhydrase family protein [Moraxella sp. Tifton1]MCL1623729.1 carbonic anhydrase family protein [Moraxella sp. Tifton1]